MLGGARGTNLLVVDLRVPTAPAVAGRVTVATATELRVAGGIVYLLFDQAAERTQRGTGTGQTKAAPGEQIVSVKRTSASDYDPLGDDEEHAEEAPLAVDQDSATAWTTETYQKNALTKPVGFPSNSSVSFTANNSPRSGSISM